MKLGFFLKESWRAMRRSAAPSFAALATVTVTLVVVGVFIPIVQATRGAANNVRGRVLVNVYMQTGATAAQESQVLRQIDALPHVRKVVFESKAQAYKQQFKQDPAAFQLLSSNPLPDTYHIYPTSASYALAVRGELMPGGRMLSPAIASVSNHRSDTKKLLEVTNLVTITAALLSILLTLASVLLIANTIRLSLFARRREVEVMKLVGATDWFIRWPFMIEGTIVGAAGAVMAIAVLGLTKVALLDPLAHSWTLVAAPRTIPFLPLVGVLVGAGILVSTLGSGISLRRYLRV